VGGGGKRIMGWRAMCNLAWGHPQILGTSTRSEAEIPGIHDPGFGQNEKKDNGMDSYVYPRPRHAALALWNPQIRGTSTRSKAEILGIHDFGRPVLGRKRISWESMIWGGGHPRNSIYTEIRYVYIYMSTYIHMYI